jgi:4-diphosphocytidyl-2-C-methyl-D-erythritol kinase
MSRTARVVAQAKLNLFLRVLAREATGYHQLETLFCRLELADDVTVRVDVRGRSLECTGPRLPLGGLGPTESNLAWRAAMAFADATGWPNGFAIEVVKNIPVGGGLGGGSADAGAVLRCLNALAPHPLPNERLLSVAASLGADVPFLTTESPLTLAWGRGERGMALAPLPARPVLLVIPEEGVSTKDAFAWLAESRGSLAPDARYYLPEELSTWSTIAATAVNDLEAVVSARRADVRDALAALDTIGGSLGGFEIVRMTGSGSTSYAILQGESPSVPSIGVARADVLLTSTATRVVEVGLAH